MDFPPSTRLPIAQLQPASELSDRWVEGLVTLVWPYSSSNRSTSILLVDPDFRLRRSKGQVRISFTEASARTVAKSGLTSGDKLLVRLSGVEWVPDDTVGRTPGKGVEWELQFAHRLILQVTHENGEPFVVEVNQSNSTPTTEPAARTPPRSPEPHEGHPKDHVKASPGTPKTWSSPAFLERKGFPASTNFEFLYDPLAESHDEVDGRSTKRTKFGRRSDQWRFVQQTPGDGGSPGLRNFQELGSSEEVDQQLREYTEDGSTAFNRQPVVSELAGDSAAAENEQNLVFGQSRQSHYIEPQVATPASSSADGGVEVPDVLNVVPSTSSDLPIASSPSLSISEPTRNVDEKADANAAQATLVTEALATVAQPLDAETDGDAAKGALGFSAVEQYVFPESNNGPAISPVDEQSAFGKVIDQDEHSPPSKDFVGFKASELTQLPTTSSEEPLPHNILELFPYLPAVAGLDGTVFSRQQTFANEDGYDRRSAAPMQAQVTEADSFEDPKLDPQLELKERLSPHSEHDLGGLHGVADSPKLLLDEFKVAPNIGRSGIEVEESNFLHSKNESSSSRSEVKDGFEMHCEDLNQVEVQDGGTIVKAIDIEDIESEKEEEEAYSERQEGSEDDEGEVYSGNEDRSNDEGNDTLDESEENFMEEDPQAEGFDQDDYQAEGIGGYDYQALTRDATWDAEQEVLHSIVGGEIHPASESLEHPTMLPEESGGQRQLLDIYGTANNRSSEVDEDRQFSGERGQFPFTPEVSGLSNVLFEREVLIKEKDLYTRTPKSTVADDQRPPALLMDADTAQKETLEARPHNHLMTPLATQVTQIVEQEVRSQADLDLLEVDDELPVSEHTQPSSEPKAPPVTPASSHPLLGILRSLRNSAVAKAENFGADRLSSTTEPWSSAKEIHKSPLIDEHYSSSTGSHDDQISEQDDNDGNLQKLERPVTSRESPLLGPEIESAEEPEGPEEQSLTKSQSPVLEPEIESPEESEEDEEQLSAKPLTVGFRTPLAYFAPLSALPEHFNSTIDTFAVVISATEAIRATKGPRDYFQTIYVADASLATSKSIANYTVVQIFRPYKRALPVLTTGDAFLLRDFKVQMQNRKPMLLSTASSAWAVFRPDAEVQIRGPHVEFGPEERAFANGLGEWWRNLDADVREEVVDRAARQSELKGKAMARGSGKRLSEGVVVHELRDGTRYTDNRADGITGVHELRDGTTYTDDRVVRQA
ncbi:hypothetical protein MMC13_004493 [Lambiella insularis]|nr:hypothetical protein [Lambiella insularis]